MSAIELLGIAGSLSLLAGWRLYLCVFATGLAMQAGWIALPEHLKALTALSSWWVIAASGIGLLAEFFADKVAWLDSLWDGIHTAIRPIGGALLALAIVDPNDGAWQVVVFLLGGGAALLGHGAKAGARAVVNASPEPVSNIALSTTEDVTSTAMIAGVLAIPGVAIVIFLIALAFCIWLLLMLRKLLKWVRGSGTPATPPL